MRLTLQSVVGPSADVVAAEIHGELVIVPLVAGVPDVNDVLFKLGQTGRAMWSLLDGHRTAGQVARILAAELYAPAGVIEADILALLDDLAARQLVEVR